MVADGMLTRKRYREVPPRVDYELTDRARALIPILGELARWGYAWAWGPPRTAESVDVGAIFRLAPGLIRAAESGTVELVVTDGKQEGEAAAYSLTLTRGQTSVEELSAERADAKISGDTDAWVRALSPGRDRGGLEISGDSQLAQLVLDGLVASAPRAERPASAAA